MYARLHQAAVLWSPNLCEWFFLLFFLPNLNFRITVAVAVAMAAAVTVAVAVAVALALLLFPMRISRCSRRRTRCIHKGIVSWSGKIADRPC